ncbi:MAG: hypothetical protein WBD46_11845 [Acidobacteriaceae bacterium]
MWIILAVFAASFVFVAVTGIAVAWAMQATAELKAWKQKHRRMVEAENARAWQTNRQMIVS